MKTAFGSLCKAGGKVLGERVAPLGQLEGCGKAERLLQGFGHGGACGFWAGGLEARIHGFQLRISMSQVRGLGLKLKV